MDKCHEGASQDPMRIDLVVNTTARLHQRKPAVLAEIQRLAAGVATVTPTRSFAELDEAARGIAARGSDLVILSGGDGTFMAGVTALTRAFGKAQLPKIALLPGGTVATVARNFGMRGELGALLRRILDQRASLRTLRRPTLRVQGTRGEVVEERIGFIFGTGLVANFFELYYADGAPGYGGAAKIVARIFAESFYGGPTARKVLDPLPCTIEVEGRALEPRAWSLVCCAVVRDLGIHMIVNHRAAEDAQRPHLVASPLSSGALGPRAPLVLAGKRIGGKGHFDDLVRDFTLRFPGEPGPYVLDGDMLRASEIRVSAGPTLDVVTLDSP
jgi:diacylglycerol kinase family enzyme